MIYENRLERPLFLSVVAASVLFGVLFLTSVAAAEEPVIEEVTAVAVATEEVLPEEVALDETVTPAELGEEAPRILPDSPWYAFKNFGRAIRSVVTRDPAKKAELKLHYANQRLLEARKLAEQGKSEDAEAALGKYQEELKKIAALKDRLKTKSAKAAPRVDAFLEKAADYTLKHQRLLDKLEEQLPPEAFAKVKEARERSIEHINEVMERLAEDRVESRELRKKFEEKMDVLKAQQELKREGRLELRDRRREEYRERREERRGTQPQPRSETAVPAPTEEPTAVE